LEDIPFSTVKEIRDMTKEQYKTKTGAIQWRPVMGLRAAEKMVIDGDGKGFCLACGKTAHGVEPDAAKYTCESCNAPKVYGLEQLMLMGLLKIK
jgi:hypothetical protein